jgi:uncharacterized membrane protein
MKKYFLTGLVILLPITITVIVLVFIMDLLTGPFVAIIDRFFNHHPWYLQYEALIHFALKIFLLFALFVFTVMLGFLARIVVFKSILSIYDYVLHRIPFIKTVYKSAQQLINTLLGSTSQSFKQVVMVKFPTSGSYCLGLISGSPPTICETTTQQKLITVFIPTTPNPTSGFLIMYHENEITYLDMKVDEAFKYIISCGVISPND